MPTHLYLAPAAAGKTEYAVQLARQQAQGLNGDVRVCVASRLQVQAWKRRLAHAGGTLGVRVLTFDGLVADCLQAAGTAYTRLSEPVQFRLLRALVQQLPLSHYEPIIDRPGFIQVLQRLIRELKSARVTPDALTRALAQQRPFPRLLELAHIYAAYQQTLHERNWADWIGLHWLATDALAQMDADQLRWPLLIVDGFDDFTTTQLTLLQRLTPHVDAMTITLIGSTTGALTPRYGRYNRTRRRVEDALGIQAAPLPQPAANSHRHATLHTLTNRLFQPPPETKAPAETAVSLIAAPDPPAEVRAALRWLKQQIVAHDYAPADVALAARDVAPYRAHIVQIAQEFKMPIRLVDGRPLADSPVIAALLDLLRLALPDGRAGQSALPRRLVVEAWRSPYFDWTPCDIGPGDADVLDVVARTGRVIAGLDQWRDALALARQQSSADVFEEGERPSSRRADTHVGVALTQKFDAFWQMIAPPATSTMRGFVQWLEQLIGPDPDAGQQETAPSLHIVARAKEGAAAAWDVAALLALKEVLRGLVWAEDAVANGEEIGVAAFVAELIGAIDAAFFAPPATNQDAILVANCTDLRGLSFRAVAVVGLAEGVFPATIREDPFLRDDDRRLLRETAGFPLEPSTRSAELELFYEVTARPFAALLLTRPRLADSGAEWVASPFWTAVTRLIDVAPQELTSEQLAAPHTAASWTELLEIAATLPDTTAVRQWIAGQHPGRLANVDHAAALIRQREQRQQTPFDGGLQGMADTFAAVYGPDHVWSASRLEALRACGFSFFVSRVLGLEPRPEPVEGLDARQLGNIYHHILEQVYKQGVVPPPEMTLAEWVTAVATPILDTAPEDEGFRPTAWWAQTRQEIIDNVVRTVAALAAGEDDFRPTMFEQPFEGLLPAGFRLRGFIDRVDRDTEGRIRIIDYKLGGPYAFSKRALAKGEKIQLPLYGMAAQSVLKLGQIADGFYWHVRHAEASKLTLATFDGGVEQAVETAVTHAVAAIAQAQQGDFQPQPPDGGCPSYCPAAAFCWQYTPGFW